MLARLALLLFWEVYFIPLAISQSTIPAISRSGATMRVRITSEQANKIERLGIQFLDVNDLKDAFSPVENHVPSLAVVLGYSQPLTPRSEAALARWVEERFSRRSHPSSPQPNIVLTYGTYRSGTISAILKSRTRLDLDAQVDVVQILPRRSLDVLLSDLDNYDRGEIPRKFIVIPDLRSHEYSQAAEQIVSDLFVACSDMASGSPQVYLMGGTGAEVSLFATLLATSTSRIHTLANFLNFHVVHGVEPAESMWRRLDAAAMLSSQPAIVNFAGVGRSIYHHSFYERQELSPSDLVHYYRNIIPPHIPLHFYHQSRLDEPQGLSYLLFKRQPRQGLMHVEFYTQQSKQTLSRTSKNYFELDAIYIDGIRLPLRELAPRYGTINTQFASVAYLGEVTLADKSQVKVQWRYYNEPQHFANQFASQLVEVPKFLSPNFSELGKRQVSERLLSRISGVYRRELTVMAGRFLSDEDFERALTHKLPEKLALEDIESGLMLNESENERQILYDNSAFIANKYKAISNRLNYLEQHFQYRLPPLVNPLCHDIFH